ncbi:hypothetical protein MUN74_07645 [Agromyces endophyticus]|uniref:hypothetical protein n=1 Tax=Agromyces sp. H17E-10 TaxID=2932244 RepID=UPI001FCF8455|nr:hypothetical protein [Agromyces sp. H17E-10]UOQ90764.1 hypothetical protein MUN74_07645 [Agromyces sp. H17E-10]
MTADAAGPTSTTPAPRAADASEVAVIGGASATLIIWWLFARLLAKDSGKPLFRRRTESPANEGAS